jgi:uncharacterized membrane protein YfcA
MPGPLAQALAIEGLWLLLLAVILAGLVRGFTGFGSGLVYMPLAAQVLPPAQAVAVMVLIDMIGPLPYIPRALRDGSPREMLWLGMGLLPGLPIGLAALFLLPAEAFRWGVSGLALVTLALLISGWQWRGPRGPKVTAAAGFTSGIVGGATALAGPPVILYYMASPLPVQAVRANLMMFLLMVDLALGAMLFVTGQLLTWVMVLAALMVLPFTLATQIGSVLFRPERAVLYRWLSWGLIAASALGGLPLWRGLG